MDLRTSWTELRGHLVDMDRGRCVTGPYQLNTNVWQFHSDVNYEKYIPWGLMSPSKWVVIGTPKYVIIYYPQPVTTRRTIKWDKLSPPQRRTIKIVQGT